MASIELLELFYKKYTGTVEAKDYVAWAIEHLDIGEISIKKLASMNTNESLNIFEIEAMFKEVMDELQWEAPAKEVCLDYYLKQLHIQLLVPTENALKLVREIYDFTIVNDLFDEQMNWQEISDAIDDFEYGDNLHHYTEEKLQKLVTAHACKLWHTSLSKVTFNEFIGQKIINVTFNPNFIIEFEKGALTIECPWRIRNAEVILLGETDVQLNIREWQSVGELLIGKKVEAVQLFENAPLLIVQTDELFLDVFHASADFDGWTLTDGADFYLFAMHGGGIA
ncbi:hypothetical protein JYK21_10230 [Ralstonia pickettii]|nr:hypothetical protein [Ralstonia pickettii]